METGRGETAPESEATRGRARGRGAGMSVDHADLRLKDEYWCCGSLQYRTATATLHVGPARVRVQVARALVLFAARPRGMERVCERAAPQAATASECAARRLHPLGGSLRRRLSPRGASRRVRRCVRMHTGTTRVRVSSELTPVRRPLPADHGNRATVSGLASRTATRPRQRFSSVYTTNTD
jgi:hypothetical protein